MEEYSIFDYSILYDMIINAWKNMIWFRSFLNLLWWIYLEIVSYIFAILLTIWTLLFVYKLLKKCHTKVTKKSLKIIINEWWIRYKKILLNFRFLLLGFILIGFNRFFISIIFNYISNRIPLVNYQLVPKEQSRFLWTLSIHALFFFIIWAYFIWFSFGNKFVRYIWIFVYIIWISIIFLWLLWHMWFYVPTE